MREIDDYLERKGAKYFVTLLMVFYVIGTFIFNVYLRSLGIFEFEILQLRYMFIGFTFVLVSMLFPLAGWLIWKIRRAWHYHQTQKKKRRLTKRERAVLRTRIERAVLVLFVPWAIAYALIVFPLIPSGFGGAKPVDARLIGKKEIIQNINELIAFETGVPVEKLPFSPTATNSELAVGANVKILDRNPNRIFLLLTRELYLSSTSSLARDLLKSGEGAEELQTDDTKNFELKPLIVKANDVLGITLSLYEPPEVLTSEDIKVAAAALASAGRDTEDTKEIVSALIEKKAPESANRVRQVVLSQTARPKPPAPKPTEPRPPVTEPKPPAPTPAEKEQKTEEIEEALAEIFDTTFLDFRAQMFNQALTLADRERLGTSTTNARLEFVQSISRAFQTDFPEAWGKLAPKNYLVDGQDDEDFPRQVSRLFQGAEDAEQLITRINEAEPTTVVAPFDEVRAGALELLEKSAQVNDAVNRKYVSQVLIRHFSQKARPKARYWSTTEYLQQGRDDEAYFTNMKTALETADSWEALGTKLGEFNAAMSTETEEYTGTGSAVDGE